MRGAVGLLLTAALAFGQQKNFVSCPIVRDTKTVPCFLAEYEGETYFLGIQQDITAEFHPPQLKHEVLVEGTIAAGPRVCGGIPLKPVSISVFKEVNLACNTLLPAEPGIEAPPAPRGPGPSSQRPQPGSAPDGPAFTILYAFNDDYLEYSGDNVVSAAASYAKRVHASSVKVSGYRAATLLSNGERLTEKSGLAEKRAQNIATVLRGLGVSNITVESKSEPETGASGRRVAILVAP